MTNPTLDARVRAFLKLAENATPGPWILVKDFAEDAIGPGLHIIRGGEGEVEPGRRSVPVVLFDGPMMAERFGADTPAQDGIIRECDTAFMIAARNDAPDLIRGLQAEVERLRERVEGENTALRAALDGLENDYGPYKSWSELATEYAETVKERNSARAERDAALVELDAIVNIAGEALGTDPSHRTALGCVKALAGWFETLRAERDAAVAERDRAWNDAIEAAALCALSLPGRPTWQAADAIRALARPGAGEEDDER